VADAIRGNGGNIDITTQGIFGIAEGRAVEGNGTNDIDASSEAGIQGNVTINRPDVDPSRGLTELPSDIGDPNNQVAQVCPTGATAPKRQSTFIVTGRGGLPPNPEDLLDGANLLTDWAAVEESDDETMARSTFPEPIVAAEPPLVEAQGWVMGAEGEVIFRANTASQPSATTTLPAVSCP
jgi:large exoprotein involved in heme utilization and adhesion